MFRYVLLASVAGSLPISTDRASFQSYRLGQSLEEVRAIPIGVGESAIFVCEGEPNASQFVQSLPSEKGVGVKLCYPTSQIGPSRVFQDLKISNEISGHSRFRFFKEKLFEIEVWSDATAAPTLLDALTRKYGRPKLTSAELQNAYGAKWEQSIYSWAIGNDSIIMKSPETAIKRMSVTYIDEPVLKLVEQQKAAYDASSVKM
jgi:hypothetical protein